jgi:hypothetical protein
VTATIPGEWGEVIRDAAASFTSPRTRGEVGSTMLGIVEPGEEVRVLRFWNKDLLGNTTGVLERIVTTLRDDGRSTT